MKRINLLGSLDISSKQMQQTSGSSFCFCGDDDEGFVSFFSFLSLSPSFLGGRGGGDAVVVVVVCLVVLGNDAFFSASASASAFNRLHSLLCPAFQCVIWHSRLQ